MDHIVLEFKIRGRAAQGYSASATIFGPNRRVLLVPEETALDLELDKLIGLTSDSEAYSHALTTMFFRPELAAALGYARGFLQGAKLPVAVRVALDPDEDALHTVRWELLRDATQRRLLATSERTMFARTLLSDELNSPTVDTPAMTCALIAVASPADSPLEPIDLDEEIARARVGLSHIDRTIVIDGQDRRPAASMAAIDAALAERPHILYLVCHGALVPEADGLRPYLYLESSDRNRYLPTPGSALVEAIAQRSERPLLVMLISCRSGGDDYGALTAIGPQLARAGVPAVLAFHGDVPRKLIEAIVPRLLAELKRDARIDRALAAARRAVSADAASWMPVLWLSVDDGRLWGIEAAPATPIPDHPLWSALLAPQPPLVRATAPSLALAALAPHLIERPDDLVAVAQALAAGRSMSTPPTVIVTGADGIGKSQLLKAFVAHYGGLFPGGVYWIACDEQELIDEELASCAVAGLLTEQERVGRSTGDLAALARAALHQPVLRLLILDGCESEGTLKDLRPASGGCCVLVSAQRTVWDPDLGTEYRLEELSPELAVQMLQTYRTELAPAQARALALSIGGRPLALHLAGSYLFRHPEISAWALLDQLKLDQHGEEQANWLALAVERSRNELYGTGDQGLLALLVLDHVAAFAPGRLIAEELLAASFSQEHLESGSLELALTSLAGMGLVTRVSQGSTATQYLTVHPVIATYLNHRRDRTHATKAVAQALAAVGEQLLLAGQPFAFRDLLPHILPLIRSDSPLPDYQLAELSSQLAAYYRLMGQVAEADQAALRSLDLYDRGLSIAAEHTVRGYHKAGLLSRALGNNQLATERLQMARSLAAIHLKEPSTIPLRVALQHQLALLLQSSNEVEAVKLMSEALGLLDEIGDPDSAERGDLLNDRGGLQYRLGQFDPAREDLRDALDIRKRRYGAEHPLVAATLRNLGYVEMERGKLSEALGLMRRALDIARAANDSLHPETVESVVALYTCLERSGDKAKARTLLERELAVVSKHVGAEHQIARLYQERLAALNTE